MNDAMVDEERGCDPLATPSDCGSGLAVPYFISFMVIGSFVFLNLVVAVILDNFTALGDVNPDLVSATASASEFTPCSCLPVGKLAPPLPPRRLPSLCLK